MRVWNVQEKFGLENLKISERPVPVPAAGEVLVRMRGAALNYRDLLMVTGRYDPRLPLPFVPLSDGAGEIVKTGSGVSESRVGERVMLLPSVDWLSGAPGRTTPHRTLGGRLDGTLSEFLALPGHAAVPLPAHLSFTEGASFACAGLTAWSALVTHGSLHAGDIVLVQGTGGVSLFAAQFALLHGARVIATTRSAEKRPRLEELGVKDIIDTKEFPEWDKRVRELTGDRGVDHIVEVGGAGTLERSLKCVQPGGTISLIGVLAGSEKPLNILPAVMRNIRMQGILIGHREAMLAMNRCVELHQMKPALDRTFSFDEAPSALRHLESAQHAGKICLTI